MAWLGAAGAAGGTGAAAGGAGAAAGTAATAGGAAGATLGATAPAAAGLTGAAAIPVATTMTPALTGTALTTGAAPTAGLGIGGAGAAPAGMTVGGQATPWYTSMFDAGKSTLASTQDMTASGQKQGKAGGKKQPDLMADAPAPIAPRPRQGYDASESNAQIMGILQNLFGATA